MRSTQLILFLAGFAACNAELSQAQDLSNEIVERKDNMINVKLNETGSEELLERWLSQAVSGMMAAFAAKKMDRLSSHDQDMMQECSKNAQSVPEHARCVVKVLDAKHIPVGRKKFRNENSTMMVVKEPRRLTYRKDENGDVKWVGSFGQARFKRESSYKVVNRDSFKIKTSDDEPILSQVARQMTATVRKMKNKEHAESWHTTLQRVKNLGEMAKKEKEARTTMKKRLRMMIDNTPEHLVDPRKPLAIKQMEMEDEAMEMKKAKAAAKSDEIRLPMKIVREAVKAALDLSGHNTTDFANKTLKFVSPRFMSIVPDQEDGLFNLLSPSLFSLHEEGNQEEKLLSLPHMLKKLEMTDQEAWMDFIIEASGVSDVVIKTEEEQKKKKQKEMRGENGQPLYFTKKNVTEHFGKSEVDKIEVFEYLDKTYNERQRGDLDKQGYTMLTMKQLDAVYGHGSPYHDQEVLRKFKRMRMRDDPHTFIESDIRSMAEAEKFRLSKRRDIVGSPFILTPLTEAGVALSQPVVLSPLVLSPITLSPAVLGPITLSPWVFVPLVLSPRVLSPLILSPLIFSPIVLSPLVLHPLILVPGIFNPIILSPLVLSPFILSPQVFTPLILSPFVLNPLILTPMAGSPLILSPFVLSPIIYSPQYLFAVVLSPYALSPLIESKLTASEVILSPSWAS